MVMGDKRGELKASIGNEKLDVLSGLMDQRGVAIVREGTATRVNLDESEAIYDGNPKVISSPLVSLTATLIMHPRGLYDIDVAATFGVPLTTVGDLHMLINDIEANKHFYSSNNWAKHGLKRIMMNNKGFFFFKFDSRAGLEVVLEGGPWLIRKSPIILKKWSMDTRLLKEELTLIPIWVKLHDVPIQVFEEDGISLIATFIGKPIMLDSYTSSMCNDSWGRSSFARCLIEVSSEADLVDVVTIGIPSLIGEDFTKETIRVEYEWRPPRCDVCKIFGHVHDQCPKKVVTPPIVSTSPIVTPTVEKTNDGFQTVGKKKKRKGKSKSNNGGQFAGPSVKQTVRYEPKATTNTPKKGATNKGNESIPSSLLKNWGNSLNKDNITSSNSFSALNVEEEDEEEEVENVYDETANLFTKTGGSSFTAAAG
ncbi:zinc knuckle CX2CX4HX4C containing protein [Tanacetum coccineum]